MMLWNCGGESTPESRRNSSSVRMEPSERLICAGSGIFVVVVVNIPRLAQTNVLPRYASEHEQTVWMDED